MKIQGEGEMMWHVFANLTKFLKSVENISKNETANLTTSLAKTSRRKSPSCHLSVSNQQWVNQNNE